jgi:hypothetical protein
MPVTGGDSALTSSTAHFSWRARTSRRRDSGSASAGAITRMAEDEMQKPRMPKTHCPSGHALEGVNLLIDNRGARICRTCRRAAVRKWQKAISGEGKLAFRVRANEQRKRDRRKGHIRHGYTRNGIANMVTREHVEQIFESVRESGALKAAYPIIGQWKMKAFLFFNPKVYVAINKLRERTKGTIVMAPAISIRRPARVEGLIERINLAVPRYLQRDHRDDVVSDRACAWLEGRLRADDIERRAIEYVRARFKSDHNKHGDLSLDVPIYLDGSATLLDRLSTEAEAGLWDINMMASTGRRK